MHTSHTCLRSLEDARTWLENQAKPLAPFGDDTDGAWQRRLVEAAFWYAREGLMRRAQEWAAQHATMTPDIEDVRTTVHLNLFGASAEPDAPSNAYVRPSLHGRPIQTIVPDKDLSVDLILPASSLQMPQAMWEAFDNGALAKALTYQGNGMFWVALQTDLLEALCQRFGPDQIWAREALASKLKESWTTPSEKRTSPRF